MQVGLSESNQNKGRKTQDCVDWYLLLTKHDIREEIHFSRKDFCDKKY